MANTVPSPNMGLPVPTVSVDPGPDWASNVNASLSILDGHNHSNGSGVLITPDGIDIDSDLTFSNSNAISLRSARFYPQGAPLALATDLGCLYESGVDLYYNDGNGNQVRITQSGSVTGSSGTITGLPSGTASASYSAGTFTFQKATNTPATIAAGSVKIGQEVVSGFGVTIAAASGQAANYGLNLPTALPSVASVLAVDASGNMSNVAYSTGQYQPTLTNLAVGISAGPLNNFSYIQIGNNVLVSGILSFEFNSNSAGNINFRISTPVASSVSAIVGGGIMTNPDNNIYITNGVITNIGNSVVSCIATLTGVVGATINLGVSFTYSIV